MPWTFSFSKVLQSFQNQSGFKLYHWLWTVVFSNNQERNYDKSWLGLLTRVFPRLHGLVTRPIRNKRSTGFGFWLVYRERCCAAIGLLESHSTCIVVTLGFHVEQHGAEHWNHCCLPLSRQRWRPVTSWPYRHASSRWHHVTVCLLRCPENKEHSIDNVRV